MPMPGVHNANSAAATLPGAECLIESLTKRQAPVTAVSLERLPLGVTTAWLADAVERHRRPLPQLSNTDGEPVLGELVIIT